MHRAFSLLLVGHALVQMLGAQSFWVDGVNGQDLPGRGTSPAQPWKTITFALSQIPAPVFPAGATVHVAGGQTYAPSTNGETFPLRAVSNVGLDGGSPRPVLSIPPGSEGLVLAAGSPFNRSTNRFEDLVFDGGDRAVRMGAAPTFRHRPTFERCEFRGQAVEAARMDTVSGSIDDPRFFSCSFLGQRGVTGNASGTAAVLQPDIVECTFSVLEGVVVSDGSAGGSSVGGTIRRSRFRQCARGVQLLAGGGTANIKTVVTSCEFERCSIGVELCVDDASNPNLRIERCGFVDCGVGSRFAGRLVPGPYTVALVGNLFSGGMRGLEIDLDGDGTVLVQSRDNVLIGAQDKAVAVNVRAPGVTMLLDSLRDRLLDNAGAGLVAVGSGAAAAVQIVSGMACRNGSDGVRVSGDLDLTLRFSTLADNGRRGFVDAGSGPRAIDHDVFANNTGGEVSVPSGVSITHSCFQNQSFAGAGNLSTTNPRLRRPWFKLAPTSPCLDAGALLVTAPSDYEGDPRAVPGRVGAQPLPDLGADEYQLGGSVRGYGVPGVGADAFEPRIGSPQSTARVGQSLRIELSGAVSFGGVAALGAGLLVGTDDLPAPLPLALATSGAPGSYLWTNAVALVGVSPVDPTGGAARTFPVPPDPFLIGRTLSFQWVTVAPAANPLGVVTSRGLRVTLGQ